MIININNKDYEIKGKVVSAKIRKELRALDEQYKDVTAKFKLQSDLMQEIALTLSEEERITFNELWSSKGDYTAWLYAFDKHPNLIEKTKELAYTPQDYDRHEEYYLKYFETAYTMPEDLTIDDIFDNVDYEEVLAAVNSFRIKTFSR